jgi:dihydroorotate dehydrogenase electron transfer subunit
VDKRIVLKIADIIQETELIKTFRFKYKLKARPGQFVMISDLENGEKPFSIADSNDDYFDITIKKVGKFTSALFQKEIGDRLMIRGAFGSSFFVSSGKVLIVAGGYAVPPMYLLTKKLLNANAKITLINGARTKSDLIYSNRFSSLPIRYIQVTESGETKQKGTAVDIAKKLLESETFDFIYSAGPDLMMKNLFGFIRNKEFEFLFERYMKCGIGVCGQCTLDPLGIRVCVEGPVLGRRFVEKLTEFGKYKRDASGQRIYYEKRITH